MITEQLLVQVYFALPVDCAKVQPRVATPKLATRESESVPLVRMVLTDLQQITAVVLASVAVSPRGGLRW